MRIKVEKGNLVVDIESMLEGLSATEKLQLADALSCTDEVVTYVAQQILDGWTEHGSHGSKGSVQPEPHPGGLDWAIREVSMRSGFIAAKEIIRLQEALKAEQEKNLKADEENAKLRRHLLTISTFE
jgi:hypothetical protein